MSKVFFEDTTTLVVSPSNIEIDILGVYSTKFSLLLKGGFGGGTLALLGGDGTTFEPIMVTNPANATLHSALTMTTEGLYTFNACCTRLKLDVTGGATPNIDVALLVEVRP